MKIKKINKYIGAEATGVNLNKPVSEEMKKELLIQIIKENEWYKILDL